MSSPVDDLLALDRDVARAAIAVGRWRTGLADEPDRYGEDDPFEGGLRRVAAKSTWDALGLLPASAADAPLRDALRRWVAHLVQVRLGLAGDVAWWRAATAPSGRWEGEVPRRASWRETWRALVQARTVSEGRRWMQAAADAGEALAPLNRARADRRAEIARRFGVAHPWDALVPVGHRPLRAAAERLLDATDDLARATSKEALREPMSPVSVIHAAVARGAGEGWPARMSARWLEDAFGEGPRSWPIRAPKLPPAVGAASFARALYAFGYAARVAARSSALPFAIGEEPAFVAAHRLGTVLGALSATPEFHRRVLGLGKRSAAAQARALAFTALLEARMEALRLLLGDDLAFAPSDRFDELCSRVLGSPLDRRLCGAWPTPRTEEPARMVAVLQAPSMLTALRERFDVDWFRNPRAWTELRARASGPALEPVDEAVLSESPNVLARAFEEALA